MVPVIYTPVSLEEPAKKLPPTVRSLSGFVNPIPTFLFSSTMSPVPPTVNKDEKRLVELAVVANELVVVALPEAKKSPSTASLAAGVVVPIPTKPLASRVKAERVEVAPVAVVEVER